jgi:predicted nucleic acid-binding protein
MRKLRVFVDTSVFGGCFDEGFDKASCQFFDEVKAGRFNVVVSERIVMEVSRAREEVKRVLFDLEDHVESVGLTYEITVLRDSYLEAGILGKSSLNDAEHIAVASVAEVDLLVSWNFKHIVHFDKIKAYNAINVLRGYGQIDIRSPQEVAGYEKDI